VLARLNQIPGVATAQVDATGQHFVILPTEEADPAVTIDQVLQILGTNSRFLEDPGLENVVVGFDPGEIWMGADNIRGLSLLEARILAANWARSATTESGLPDALASHLADLLRVELVKELDRVHAEGGTSERNWYKRAFPAAFERAIAGMEMISPAQADSLRECLLRSLNG
jgi:hypothetical protein